MTDVEQVRLLIGDRTAPLFFEDEDLEGFLELEDDDVKLAAAAALESWASSLGRDALSLKSLDVQMDTRGRAKDLMALAKQLRDRADDDGSFEIAEQIPLGDAAARRERLIKDRQRS